MTLFFGGMSMLGEYGVGVQNAGSAGNSSWNGGGGFDLLNGSGWFTITDTGLLLIVLGVVACGYFFLRL